MMPAIDTQKTGGSFRWAWQASLRVRLLVATLGGVAVALLLAYFALSGLFRDHVQRQFESALRLQLDQLTARLEFDSLGQPMVDASLLSDPRWDLPYSGLYWQLDGGPQAEPNRIAVLRSRSLWDASLQPSTQAVSDGAVHAHETRDAQGRPLLVLERMLRPEQWPDTRWRLAVAADLQDTHEAVARLSGQLAVSLAFLLVLLGGAAWAQVAIGLQPLQALKRSLRDVQQAQTLRLEGHFPAEVQPLVEGFNSVLDRNGEIVARARTQAGNLAHALKTPLSVLECAAQEGALARQVHEQVAVARRHIDWHLARSRVAATQRLPGQRTEVAPVLAGLVRVMERVHAHRGIRIEIQMAQPPLFFAGEEQDLQEMLGNLLDNACKWANTRVVVRVACLSQTAPAQLRVEVEDDGPGIRVADLEAAVTRGVRLDESVPGSGLGLAIVHDLVSLYGGGLSLENPNDGGLVASLSLPAL